MKSIVMVLAAALVALTGVVVWLAWPEPVTAAELIKATGAKYWRYRIPDSYRSNQVIGVEVATGDGKQSPSGGSGFQPGQILKVFLIPSEDGSTFRWSIVGDKVAISSSISNPFVGGSHSYPPIGSVLHDNVLMRGIESQQTPSPPTIRIAIHE